ncbi:hypothetical protein F3Y22_tig00111100pilonHSYRG00132 [Hibiscus syriacus]|uniref:Uncharacterized protein n=1 Tax=Hibiscus syriacus TaxID=106335 RepID=A0A6A2YZU9_HIBSY|nr:hypothetical protein F3Y22_tig00111100pilonHSYRG00132 [Hibiscus syriacus]
MYNLDKVQDALVSDDFDVKVSQWHGLLVVLEFASARMLINEMLEWGTAISIDEDTLNRNRFDEARVLVAVQEVSLILERVVIHVNDRAFGLKLQVEEFDSERTFIYGRSSVDRLGNEYISMAIDIPDPSEVLNEGINIEEESFNHVIHDILSFDGLLEVPITSYGGPNIFDNRGHCGLLDDSRVSCWVIVGFQMMVEVSSLGD